MHREKFYCFIIHVFFFLSFIMPLSAIAEDYPTYTEAITLAYNNAADPTGWQPAANKMFNIPEGGGSPSEGLVYDGTGLVVRTETNAWKFSSDYVGEANYKIFGNDPQSNAAWVTTGNDATTFLDNHGVTASNVSKLLERGLGMENTGGHDAIVEYTVSPEAGHILTDRLMRPTRNPDITQYLPDEYGSGLDFSVKPVGMDDTAWTNFKGYYNYWKNRTKPDGAAPFPWTQLGYTYFYGNGTADVESVRGMTEFIILAQTPVDIYGIYAVQSYVYTKNSGEYGNGYASFNVTNSCDTIWAGHRFQKKTLAEAGGANTITIGNGGTVSGGSGILVWSLNYAITNNGSITGSTTDKFGISNTSNIGILFKGDTSSDFGTPVLSGLNKVTNNGTISNPGVAIRAEAGGLDITNNANAGISGGTYALYSLAGTATIANSGTIANSLSTAIMIDSGNAGITNNVGGTISGGTYAIQTGTGNDTLTVKGGEIYGSIDMSSGTDTMNVTGADGDPTFNFLLDTDAASSAQIARVETVNFSAANTILAIRTTGTRCIPNNENFLIVDTNTLTADESKFTVQNSTSQPMITFEPVVSGSQLYLVAERQSSYYGANSGNSSLGGVLDSLANTATGDMAEVIGSLDRSGNAGNAEQLEPSVNNGALEMSNEALGQFVNTVTGHVDSIITAQNTDGSGISGVSTGDPAKESGIWAQGFTSYMHQDPRGSSNGYNASVWGVSGGYDTVVIDDFVLGLSSGFAQDYVRTKDASARTDVNSVQGSVYAGYIKDPFYLESIFTFMYNMYDTSRHVSFGAVDRVPKGDYNGQQYSGYLEGGYAFKNEKFELTPLASIQYMHLHLNSYEERDADSVNLKVDAQDYDMFQTGLGAKLGYHIEGKTWKIVPDVHVKWLYDWIGDREESSSAFSGGGAAFATSGFKPARSSYSFGTETTVLTKYNITLSLNYDFGLKEDFYSHSGYANMRYDF